jgi:hypothetical protein
MTKTRLTKADLIALCIEQGIEHSTTWTVPTLVQAIEHHQSEHGINVGDTVVVSTDALSQDEARIVAHRMGRPVWEGGESRQAFDARLAAWKSAQAS